MRVFIPTCYLFLFSVIISSCSGKGRNAKDYLSEAEAAYQQGNFALAKLKIDSIQLLFPKAFNEINTGFALMQDVRMAENRRNIVYCDSMLQVHYKTLNDMLTRFDYVRDDRYQEFGDYYPKVYPVHASLNRDGIRSGVGEKGTLFIESILIGRAIRHNKIKVSSKDGNFAETLSVTSDGLNYSFRTIDKSYEIVRYSGNNENGVAKFIYTFQNEPLTVTFIGSRSVSVAMNDASRKGIGQSFELSVLLTDIERLKFEKEKSETLIRYLQSRKNN